jgi:hypothetical protein
MEWIVITLSILLTVCAFIIVNLLRKYDKLEETVLNLDDTIQHIRARTIDALSQMRVIDSKGGFESDDEIGVIFKSIKDIISELKNDIEESND